MKIEPKRWSKSNVWGSWNRQCINSIMMEKELCEVRIGVFKKSEKRYEDKFSWVGVAGNPSISYYEDKGVYRTGYHSIYGDYSEIGLFMQDFRFELEFAGEGKEFVYKISPQTLSDDYEIYIGFLIGAQKKSHSGERVHITEHGCTFQMELEDYIIDIDGEKTKTTQDMPYVGHFYSVGEPIYIRCNKIIEKKESDIFIKKRKEEYLAHSIKGEGVLGNGIVESMIKGMAWNKVYDHIHDTFKADVTRLWTPESCYYTFYWDNFLTSLIFAMESKEMAYDQVDSVCHEFVNGHLPQCAIEWGAADMVNPPVGSFCLMKLYKQYQDIDLLSTYFELLYDTNTFILNSKSPRLDGVLTINNVFEPSDIETKSQILGTGLDNSPMYDNAKETNLNDIGMTSIYALDCKMLCEIAHILGKDEEAKLLEERYLSLKNRINETMWDEANGIYCNTLLDGTYQTIYSPTSFYPMIAGVATMERAKRMIAEHLLNEDEFWGEYVIPSISKKELSFHDQDYWRGCAWAPMNYLVYEGLKTYGLHEICHELSQKSLSMYSKNWLDHGWILENFSTKTGSITKNCVPMYTWGGLMAYMAVEELIEASPIVGIRFGSLSSSYCVISNFPIMGSFYEVRMKDGVEVYQDNNLIIKTDVPAIIQQFTMSGETWSMEIIAKKAGNCVLYTTASYVNVKIDGVNKRYEVFHNKVEISWA